MTIAAGQLAPTFQATTYTGEPISLEQYRGRKVWLGFYRWASCPLCNLRMTEVLERYEHYASAGIELICVFQSPADNIAKFVGKQNPPFPLIADPDLDLYTLYGVHPRLLGLFYPRVATRAVRAIATGFFSLTIDGPTAMIPADFLVDPEGLVWKAWYGRAVTDHIPFEEVEGFREDLCLDMPDAKVS